MIAFIQGEVVQCHPTSVIIQNPAGLGIEIEISLQTYEQIKDQKQIKLYTHLHLKKDGQALSAFELYGFSNIEEKKMFEQLISVSGIGTNTARVMLSSISSEDVRHAIASENEALLSSIKGIGPKTAKRVILELKDKMLKISEVELLDANPQNNLKEDALYALTALGFQKNAIQKAFSVIEKQHPDINNVEDYIKHALKIL